MNKWAKNKDHQCKATANFNIFYDTKYTVYCHDNKVNNN